MAGRPFTLVLGGGGLKGLAHIGVFEALQERALEPDLVIGTSMGALIAAAWASGVPNAEMRARALAVRRRHVFQVAHMDMAFRRLLSPAIYHHEPLYQLIHGLVGDRYFDDLIHPLLINTADLHSGQQVFWGLPGRRDARVADAVFASCALPGIFPAWEIRGRRYMDGAVIENLPVGIAATASRGPIVAVNLTPTGFDRPAGDAEGFAATYIRGLKIVMQTQLHNQLQAWAGPPLLLVQPRVEHVSMFAFDQTPELLHEGRRALHESVDAVGGDLHHMERGIHPRRRVRVTVNEPRCIGCGLCALRAPEVFRMRGGKAQVTAPDQVWSPVDGGYVRECPVDAIGYEPERTREVRKAK